MICFIALFVFGVLSIFSAKYRPFAKQAFDCTFRRLTLRACNTSLEEEVKSKTVAWALSKNAAFAKLLNRHWELLSWAFTLLMFASLAYSLLGLVNYIYYGDCNGPTPGGFCIYSELFGNGTANPSQLIAPSSLAGIQKGNANASVVVTEFGCYSCPYTKDAEPKVQKLISEFSGQTLFVFKHFPLPTHNNSYDAALAAMCANDEGKYWEYRAALFERQDEFRSYGNATFLSIASSLSLQNFTACLATQAHKGELDSQIAEGLASRIYGTPTFFINGKALVAPATYEELANPVKEALANAQ
ncbi:thioredoxin domain-containing protein [Candidatus Micrarchaeota archaeon]|nr:thioredoxin domain-containing protein [Candidatus Micrarchaeota archaeon]